MTSEATIAQRIVRAKRKVVVARIHYAMPDHPTLGQRLQQVLTVLYLMVNEGYLPSQAGIGERPGLLGEAEQLTALVTRLLPKEPEPLGLLALVRLHEARSHARFNASGDVVPLRDQDRRTWDRLVIADGLRLLERAATLRRPGPYQLQAAIVAVHVESSSWESTDWAQILALYDALLSHQDTPIVRLNRAVGTAEVTGPTQSAPPEASRQGTEKHGREECVGRWIYTNGSGGTATDIPIGACGGCRANTAVIGGTSVRR